jgi:hypothetical protein
MAFFFTHYIEILDLESFKQKIKNQQCVYAQPENFENAAETDVIFLKISLQV